VNQTASTNEDDPQPQVVTSQSSGLPSSQENEAAPSSPNQDATGTGDLQQQSTETHPVAVTMNLTVNIRHHHHHPPTLRGEGHHHHPNQPHNFTLPLGQLAAFLTRRPILDPALMEDAAAAAAAAGVGGNVILDPDPLLQRARHRIYSVSA